MSGEVQPTPKGPSLLMLAYGQVAAMLGAFSLLVFITHFIDVGLKGLIRDAFDVWAGTVRPIVGAPMQWLVGLLPWHIAVPEVVKDYFAVGLMLALSFHRMSLVMFGGRFPREAGYFVWLLVCALLWPVAVPWTIWGARKVQSAGAVKALTVWLAPLAYLLLLFAANAWLV